MSFEKNIRRVTPYTPGEQPKRAHIVKLNTNECPYPPSPKVKEALGNLNPDDFRLYPDPEAMGLKEAMSKAYGLPTSQIFVGVGSDEVLALAFQTFFAGKEPILFPDVTYSFYPVWAELYGVPFKKVALDGNYRVKAEDYKVENGGIIIPNPNAPTGVLEPLEKLEEIISANPDSVVIVDEAYIDFAVDIASASKAAAGIASTNSTSANNVSASASAKATSLIDSAVAKASALPLIAKYENLLVVQTFSKSRGMAGMRIGMAFGSKKLIKYLSDIKFSFNSYTMSRAAITLGAASLGDQEYFGKTVSRIIRTRERTKETLAKMGWSFPDPKANFIFARPPKGNAGEIFEKLKEKGIYVRYFNAPRTSEYLRITIGTEEQMDELFKALEELI